MIWLVLSVLSATLIFVIFKILPRYGANTFHTIVINYATACLLGLSSTIGSDVWLDLGQKKWLWPGLLSGLLFIGTFYLMAYTAQKISMALSSLAAKMSLILPVLLLVLLHDGETLGPLKIIGLLMALTGVYLSIQKASSAHAGAALFLFPLAIFIGNGLIDYILSQLSGPSYINAQVELQLLAAAPFFTSACLGFAVMLIGKKRHNNVGAPWILKSSLKAGLALGVVNFVSIYCLMQALQSGIWQQSAIIPINNVSIVLVSTLLGIVVFKERFSARNKLGFVLALSALLLIGIFS